MKELLFVRLFAEVDTEESAHKIAQEVLLSINKYALLEKKQIRKYWKISSEFEIFFKLKPIHNLSEDYESILRALGSGWKKFHQYEHIWNQAEDRLFMINNVKWAHIEAEVRE
jgi:hypothetical protein